LIWPGQANVAQRLGDWTRQAAMLGVLPPKFSIEQLYLNGFQLGFLCDIGFLG